MTTAPTALPHVTALCLLEAYNNAHQKGNVDLKSSMWKLNKARRQRGNGASISAIDVREDLRARAVLRESTPSLTVEGETNEALDEEDYFELVDAVEEIAEIRGQKENNAPTTNAGTEQAGLRRRNKAGEEDKKEWTQENNPDEDDRLRNANPVDLFGAFPPRDLIAAQKEAKKSLAAYIEAANLAKAILQITNIKQK